MKKDALFPIGVAVGISIGIVVGIKTDNVGLWLSLGIAIGASLGIALSGLTVDGDQDKNDQGETPDKEK